MRTILSLCLVILFTTITQLYATCPITTYNDGYITTDGTNYLTITSPNVNLGGGASWTIEAWIKRTVNGAETFWLGVGPITPIGWPADGSYLHLGYRTGNNYAYAFWGDDYNGPTNNYLVTDGVWHHWAYRYKASDKKRRVYRDGAQLGELAAAHHLPGLNQPWMIGAILNGVTFQFKGDIDEIMMFDYTLTTVQVQAHAAGNYFGDLVTTGSNRCGLWLRFNEGSGTEAHDSCYGFANLTAVWTGTPIWKTNANNPICLPGRQPHIFGFWNSWKIVLPSPTVRVGNAITVEVHQVDQYGNSMTDYEPPPGASSVTINMIGGTGSMLTTTTVVSLNVGMGTFPLMNNVVESITFAFVDSAITKRLIGANPSPTLSFTAPDLSAVSFSAATMPIILYDPPLKPLVYNFVCNSTSWSVTSINVQAMFMQTLTISVNSGDISFLTTGSPFAIDLIQGVNTIQLFSTEEGSFTYTFIINRLPPDLSNVQFISTPILTSLTPAFVGGNFIERTGSVPGILTVLSVKATFVVADSVTLTVNGVSFGAMSPSTPMDVSSALSPNGVPNIIQVVTTADGGVHTYTFNTECPVPYSCTKAPAGSGCAYNCQYCTGTTFRLICLLERSDCCGQGDCAC